MDLSDLVPVAIGFVVVGIVLAFGQSIMGSLKSSFVTGSSGCNSTATTSCGYDWNATVLTQSANDNVAQKLPLLGLVIAAAIIIGVLLRAFRQ